MGQPSQNNNSFRQSILETPNQSVNELNQPLPPKHIAKKTSYGSISSLRKSFNGTSPPVKRSMMGSKARGSPRNTLNGTSSSSKAIMSKHMNTYQADLKKQEQHSFANDKTVQESTIFVENSFADTKELTQENIEIDNLKTIIVALKQKLTSQEDTQLELQ